MATVGGCQCADVRYEISGGPLALHMQTGLRRLGTDGSQTPRRRRQSGAAPASNAFRSRVPRRQARRQPSSSLASSRPLVFAETESRAVVLVSHCRRLRFLDVSLHILFEE